ncbi:Tetratricopeptide repeat-containing protein [Maricaulis salignorans]|uniref:Tetratricopeptide repeat-containing protein n=2 Tax=Maricaulis salignorans TaxID=144026 RepID=A0A1G9LYT0_9PROT|nr:Tetratricopeptide repeat-containing protein [Maricaulis salignorans]
MADRDGHPVAASMDSLIANPAPKTRMAEIDRALRARQLGPARSMLTALLRDEPGYVEAWIAAARLEQMGGDHAAMRQHLSQALVLAPNSPLVRLLDVEALVHLGAIREAMDNLGVMEAEAGQDSAWMSRLSESYTQCGAFEAAERCARQAVALDPEQPAIRYNFASSLIATGKLEESEREFNQLLARTPHDYDAYYNRATLRKQTVEDNHLAEIQRMLKAPKRTRLGEVQLNYALALELENLGQFEESFVALKRGAEARRAMMAYRVEGDVATMARIAEVFDAGFFARQRPCDNAQSPVFVLGLPRSGTTLVDRILSAHPLIESLGELNDWPLALTGLTRGSRDKSDMVSRSGALDMRKLAADYLLRVSERRADLPFFIDKAPANFLYIGLIAAALPNARIIHLNRDPMDNALGMYKALFRMGYPFSYDFSDLAQYMRAKDRLMDHWRRVLPGRILDVNYEDIITDQEGETRRLLDHVGVDWDPACLDFHKNASPTATASAAQVRQPLYGSAVGRWRRYERELAPLAEMLGVTS